VAGEAGGDVVLLPDHRTFWRLVSPQRRPRGAQETLVTSHLAGNTHIASTTCYGDSFTFLYVDDVRTSEETPMGLHGL
jgi:hypothetical protein